MAAGGGGGDGTEANLPNPPPSLVAVPGGGFGPGRGPGCVGQPVLGGATAVKEVRGDWPSVTQRPHPLVSPPPPPTHALVRDGAAARWTSAPAPGRHGATAIWSPALQMRRG